MQKNEIEMLTRIRDWLVSKKWSASQSGCKEAFGLYCELRDFIAAKTPTSN